MKNKTKLQTAPGEARAGRTGPVKGKTQITVRVDDQLMRSVYAQIKQDNFRITDAIERGLILWLGEARHALPSWNKQIRFILANITAEQAEAFRGFAIALMENEVKERSAEAEAIYDLCMWFVRERNLLVHGGQCLELYSRYGKSAAEIAKLG
jgi:hypothetical protein